MCVDMRKANEAVQRERYPLPVFEDILNDVSGSRYFSTLDLNSAYHQIELEPKSREITTFITHIGTFRYKRLMFGISCAPEIYQRIMRSVLSGLEGVTNFLDDILVYAKTKEEHDERLKKAFQRLVENGLTLNKEKCKFGEREITFLGFKISGDGYRPLESKVEAVKNFRKPNTPEEVRSFLGLVNFCAPFIKDLATVSEPLRCLMRKDTKFKWGTLESNAFETLKKTLCDAKTLGMYDPNAPTRVIADASPVGLGAVLTQKGLNEWQVIRFASRSLTDCEKRYSQTEKEALALVYACERFHNWIYGLEFELVTDHKALECIFTPRSKPSARIERWVLRMQPYKYRVKYEKGKTNIADSLSRLTKTVQTNDENDLYVNFIVNEAVSRDITKRN